MTTWRLVVAPSAERNLARIPTKVAHAILEFMVGPLLDSPNQVGKPLLRELSGYMVAGRVDCRLIFRINEASSSIEVVRIDRRSRIYRTD